MGRLVAVADQAGVVVALCFLLIFAVESSFPATTSRAMNAASNMILTAPGR